MADRFFRTPAWRQGVTYALAVFAMIAWTTDPLLIQAGGQAPGPILFALKST